MLHSTTQMSHSVSCHNFLFSKKNFKNLSPFFENHFCVIFQFFFKAMYERCLLQINTHVTAQQYLGFHSKLNKLKIVFLHVSRSCTMKFTKSQIITNLTNRKKSFAISYLEKNNTKIFFLGFYKVHIELPNKVVDNWVCAQALKLCGKNFVNFILP